MMMTLAQAAGSEMGSITLSHYLFVSAAMFCIGLIGFLTRRNLIIMFLCTELMFQGQGYTTPKLGNAFPIPQPDGSVIDVTRSGEAFGGHALARVSRERGSTGDRNARGFQVQAYYDVEHRENVIGFRQERDTIDGVAVADLLARSRG